MAPRKFTSEPPTKPKIQTIGQSVLERTLFKVRHEGQEVVLVIGNHEVRMDYPTALNVAHMLRAHGRQAKKFAGDYSRKFEVGGVLTDLEQHERLNFK
jgi:hypothetical protein